MNGGDLFLARVVLIENVIIFHFDFISHIKFDGFYNKKNENSDRISIRFSHSRQNTSIVEGSCFLKFDYEIR
jgi:hypothetical protein